MYKHLYSRFLNENPEVLHMACHSHQYWPDVTFDAMQEYWMDSARYADDKWDYFFTEKIPEAQKLIAETLNLSNHESIVFAPNTHELLYRLCSCFYSQKPFKVLTTGSEFHSFHRQSHRLEEEGLATVNRIEVTEDFESRFISEALNGEYDLIFFSQVFFDSGTPVNLSAILDKICSTDSVIAVDGYHAFCALPTDLKKYENRIFYLAGSYKYAQGGEGCCFMHVPENNLKPLNTGWFAGFADLEGDQSEQVQFATGAMRFAGSTMDFSPLYRLSASLKMLKENRLTVEKIHAYIQNLQEEFLKQIDTQESPFLSRENLLINDLSHHGHFLTFKMSSAKLAGTLHSFLKENGIATDFRNDRLRFGFALYHNPEDYNFSCLKQFSQCMDSQL